MQSYTCVLEITVVIISIFCLVDWLHSHHHFPLAESQSSISASTPQTTQPATEKSLSEEAKADLSMCNVTRFLTAYGTKYVTFAKLILLFHAAVDDHLEITNYLLDLGPTEIYNLGLTLGLNHRHLKSMQSSDTFREDVIDAWLQKEDQVLKKGVPTWKTLVKALKDRRVNQIGVAEKIETEKCC